MTGRLAGKVAVITGGNSGIGQAAARRFAEEGAVVVIVGRNDATLASTARELGVEAIRADLAQAAGRKILADEVRRRYGRVDALFANAGISHIGTIEATTEADFETVLRVNLTSVFFTIQALLPLMGVGAAIVLNGSMAARTGSPANAAYAASKAGVRALGHVLAGELSPRGIRVNTVVPGPTRTPMWNVPGATPEATAAREKRVRGMVPLGRFGEPGEIASVALFLASDEAAFVQGAEIAVDGGVTGAPGGAPIYRAAPG